MNNYVVIYIVGLVSAIMYPPWIIHDGGWMYWDWIWESHYERSISFFMLGTEIVVITLIFLALMFFGKKK
jgi:hypothetical protein